MMKLFCDIRFELYVMQKIRMNLKLNTIRIYQSYQIKPLSSVGNQDMGTVRWENFNEELFGVPGTPKRLVSVLCMTTLLVRPIRSS
jgi:hypothetical protein